MTFSPFSFNLTKNRYRTFIAVTMVSVASIQEGFSTELDSEADDGDVYPMEPVKTNASIATENINVTSDYTTFQQNKLNLAAEIERDVNEEEYLKFLKVKLVWTNPDNPSNKIELKISDLADPFNGEFDLTACGDASKSIAIMTGYRKNETPNPAHKGKVEIWLTPRFLVESEDEAAHLKPLLRDNRWNQCFEMMFVWNWNAWDMGRYLYLPFAHTRPPSHSNPSAKSTQTGRHMSQEMISSYEPLQEWIRHANGVHVDDVLEMDRPHPYNRFLKHVRRLAWWFEFQS